MALIKCSECGAIVSDQAVACPQCGAPVTARPKQQPPRKTPSALGIGCLVILGIGVIGAIVGGGGTAPSNEATAETNTPAEKTAEEKAQSERATMAALAVASLKKSLRDPDSFTLERAFTTVDAKYACILYRARNGFGGMNREHVVFTMAGGDQSASAWNKRCVDGEFSEQTANARNLSDVLD